MELIERYIYAVTHRLPQSQREDIAKELRGLIEDMLEERGQEDQVTEKQVEDVLLELGDPRKLADKYRGTKRYLIGPELFDHYLMVLKIALIATGVVIGATFVIQVMLDPSSILESFISLIVSTVNGIPMAFGWTTFGFAVIQFVGAKQLNVNLQEKKSWNPSDLPVVPDPKGRVKRGDAIAGIVFYTIFIAIFGVSNEYFGVWFFEDGKFHNVIPFFNEDWYGYYFLFIVLMFGFGIIKECLKLIYGRWTMKLVIFTLIVNVISGIGLLFVIAEPAIWNPDFMSQLIESGLVVAQSEGYEVISFIWEKVTYWLFILWLFALVWDVVDGYIRVWRSKRSE